VKPVYVVALFALWGAALEFAALYVGVAFSGFKDFGPHWLLAAIYYVGFLPDSFLPTISAGSKLGEVYFYWPVIFWALIGVVFTRLVRKSK